MEVYGPRRPVCDIPKVMVTFGAPVVNGQRVVNPSAKAVCPKGVPDQADAVAADGALAITLGEPVTNRQQRSVQLIAATP